MMWHHHMRFFIFPCAWHKFTKIEWDEYNTTDDEVEDRSTAIH